MSDARHDRNYSPGTNSSSLRLLRVIRDDATTAKLRQGGNELKSFSLASLSQDSILVNRLRELLLLRACATISGNFLGAFNCPPAVWYLRRKEPGHCFIVQTLHGDSGVWA